MTIENNLIAKALLHKQFTLVQSKEESRTRIARKTVDGNNYVYSDQRQAYNQTQNFMIFNGTDD